MAEERKADGRHNPIPPALADDHEDVSWALSTAKSTWDRGEHMDALKWLRRAVEAASEAEADDRALMLAKAAADLTTTIDELGWDLGTIRPPPTAAATPEGENVRPTVRLSPIVVPAAQGTPSRPGSAPSPAPVVSDVASSTTPSVPQAGLASPSVPQAPAAPPRRLSTPNPSPAPGRVSPGRISQGAPAAVPRPGQPTGSALLGNAAGARPKPSLGLLGPRPKTGETPILQGSGSQPPPLPPRASRPPSASRPTPSPARAPTPPPPPAARVQAPAVIEAISSKNLISAGMASAPAAAAPNEHVQRALDEAEVTRVVELPISSPHLSSPHLSSPHPDPPPRARESAGVPSEGVPFGEPQPGSDPDAVSIERERTTKPAGPWDDGSEDNAFAPTPVYPSGPESITFVAPHLAPSVQMRAPLIQSGVGPVATPADEALHPHDDALEKNGEAPHAESERTAMPTAPPASASSLESILRNATFATAEEMESWPTETGRGGDYSSFTFDESAKTRAGTSAYQEEAAARSVASSPPQPPLDAGPRAESPSAVFDSTSRIAARGPVQKPSQAVRVVVWRGPDGVHIAPHGTTVTAISVDALLVALDPSADLFAWLTNK